MLKGHPERVFWWHELWRWLWGQSRLLSVASSLTRAPRSRYSLRTHLPPRVAGSRRRRSPVADGPGLYGALPRVRPLCATRTEISPSRLLKQREDLRQNIERSREEGPPASRKSSACAEAFVRRPLGGH